MHTDGGARGNPGPAGAAWSVSFPGTPVKNASRGRYIGIETNNRAEYTALIDGLSHVASTGFSGDVECISDSELVVRQMNGVYAVKNPGLKPLHDKVKKLASSFRSVSFTSVPRSTPGIIAVDALVNQAIDHRLT